MILGTTNPHKVREIGGLCAPLDIELEPLALDIPEDGVTFEENALAKAKGYALACPDQYVLVEDSGLVVPALDGLPGPWSARFADFDLDAKRVTPSGRDREVMDQANCERLVAMMAEVPEHRRGATFVISIVVARAQGDVAILFHVTREVSGWVLPELRGAGGFGYDCVFASDSSFGKSWAEIDLARKGLISHRSEALWDLSAWLCSEAAKSLR